MPIGVGFANDEYESVEDYYEEELADAPVGAGGFVADMCYERAIERCESNKEKKRMHMKNTMQIALNLEEALFVQSAMKSVLRGMSKQDLEIFWPGADIANILRQLDITIDILFSEGGSKL